MGGILATRRGRFDDRVGLREVPRLSAGMMAMIDGIEAAGGRPFGELRFLQHGRPYLIEDRSRKRILVRLLHERLIEVVGLSPAVYRVTELGRLARRLRR